MVVIPALITSTAAPMLAGKLQFFHNSMQQTQREVDDGGNNKSVVNSSCISIFSFLSIWVQ